MAITNGYATLAELREHMGDTNTVLVAAVAERAINAASRAIDKFCGRWFWQSAGTSTRVYRPDDPYTAWVDDISTTTGLVIKTDTSGDGTWATTWDTGDYQLEPLNQDVGHASDTVEPYAWWRIEAIDDKAFPLSDGAVSLQVTARFGWSGIPDDVREACLLKSARLYKRRDSAMGVAGFGDMGVVRITARDSDIAMLLGPYRKDLIGAV